MVVVLLAAAPRLHAQQPLSAESMAQDEQRTEAVFDSVRRSPLLLRAFLHRFPKGGDLHNHLSGAVYAESYIQWAADEGLCVDTRTFAILPADSLHGKEGMHRVRVKDALTNSALYRSMIDEMSLRNFRPLAANGSNQFFDSFGKFGLAGVGKVDKMLLEVVRRAIAEKETYLELMYTPDYGEAGSLLSEEEWSADLVKMTLLVKSNSKFTPLLARCMERLSANENVLRDSLDCGGTGPARGCAMRVRFLYQIARGVPLAQFFAQTLTAFETATKDTFVVGINIVQPEEGYLSMKNFNEEMRIIGYLHSLYPTVHISLHAGEFFYGLIPPEQLGTHIRASIDVAHAERIGHGVDAFFDRAPKELMAKMSSRKIAVEICLTSNREILGIRAPYHPFPLYWNAGVPLVLCTDDEGVSRSDLTNEFQIAVEEYRLTYADIKRLARNSVRFSFLSGDDMWYALGEDFPRSHCFQEMMNGHAAPPECEQIFASSEKARAEFELEKLFVEFERTLQ